jgi:hypothetical protein
MYSVFILTKNVTLNENQRRFRVSKLLNIVAGQSEIPIVATDTFSLLAIVAAAERITLRLRKRTLVILQLSMLVPKHYDMKTYGGVHV